MARTPGRFIVEAKDLVIGYDEPLTRPVSFTIERGEKIAVIRTNGLGKTTLKDYSGSDSSYLRPGVIRRLSVPRIFRPRS